MTKHEKRLAIGLGLLFILVLWLLFRNSKPVQQLIEQVQDAFGLPSVELSGPPEFEPNEYDLPSIRGKTVKGDTCSMCLAIQSAIAPASKPLSPDMSLMFSGSTVSHATNWNNMSGNPPTYFDGF